MYRPEFPCQRRGDKQIEWAEETERVFTLLRCSGFLELKICSFAMWGATCNLSTQKVETSLDYTEYSRPS